MSELSSWRDGPAKEAITDFVARVCGDDGSDPVPVEDRVAVFDTDGTLWCEKPMPIQRRGPTSSCAALSIRRSAAGTSSARTRRWSSCSRISRRTGSPNYIASGGGRDFMRPISQELYGIPRQRVIGSSAALAYTSDERGGTITHKPEADYLDDGPEKPIRIWNRTGRRPLLAAGNSNGDVPMLHFTQHSDKPTLRLLVLHDDAEREFAYTAGAEQALDEAAGNGWSVISVKNDWATVF